MPNQKIPNGDESDSYCVINNVANREERKNNSRSDFLDDCGTWDTNTEDFIWQWQVRESKKCFVKKEKHHRSGNLWNINLQMKLEYKFDGITQNRKETISSKWEWQRLKDCLIP